MNSPSSRKSSLITPPLPFLSSLDSLAHSPLSSLLFSSLIASSTRPDVFVSMIPVLSRGSAGQSRVRVQCLLKELKSDQSINYTEYAHIFFHVFPQEPLRSAQQAVIPLYSWENQGEEATKWNRQAKNLLLIMELNISKLKDHALWSPLSTMSGTGQRMGFAFSRLLYKWKSFSI